jgi:hypothetical protein
VKIGCYWGVDGNLPGRAIGHRAGCGRGDAGGKGAEPVSAGGRVPRDCNRLWRVGADRRAIRVLPGLPSQPSTAGGGAALRVRRRASRTQADQIDEPDSKPIQ